jgi:hypothetical protein
MWPGGVYDAGPTIEYVAFSRTGRVCRPARSSPAERSARAIISGDGWLEFPAAVSGIANPDGPLCGTDPADPARMSYPEDYSWLKGLREIRRLVAAGLTTCLLI